MKKILLFFAFVLSVSLVEAQVPEPAGFPAPYSTGYYRIGWVQSDSGFIMALRDTTVRSRFAGLTFLWQHSGVDSSSWLFNGSRYIKQLNAEDTLPSRFLVTPSFLSSQGFLKNITGFIQQGTNVTITGSGTIGSPYVINATGSTSADSAVNTGLFLKQNISGTTKLVYSDTSFATGFSGYYLRRTDTNTFVTPTQLATGLSTKQGTITLGSTSQYFRGDLSLATFPTNLSSFTNGPGYITGNQSISFTASGDINGTYTNPTTLTPTLTINSNAVTYSKFQQASGQGLLGAQSSGNYQLVTLGSGLSMTAGVLSATGGGGSTTLSNNGSGFRLVEPLSSGNYPIQSLKCSGCTIDSTSNVGSLTITVSGGGGGITQLLGKAPVVILGTDTVTVDTLSGSQNLATQGWVTRNTAASVSNVDGTLTISPTTGAVVASLALGHANTWITNPQTFNGGLALGSNVTFGTDNTYSIGTSSSGANAIYSRFLTSPGILSLSTVGSNPIVFAPNSVTAMQLAVSGQGQLSRYTTATSFTGTALAYLQTDASGNIIQIPVGSVGTLTSFNSGNLSPLFTTSNTGTSTAPILSFTLSNAAGNSVFGNSSGTTGAPSFFVPNATIMNTWFGGGGIQAQLSGTGYILQASTTSGFVSGSATNLIGYNASGTGSAIVLGTNLSMTGNTLNASGGVGSQTWQQTLTTGPTLTGANTIVNTGNIFTWTNGGTGLWKYSGISHDTTSTFGLLGMAKDSSVRAFSWQNVASEISPLLPTFNIFPVQGLSPIGNSNDSIALGGIAQPFYQNDTIFVQFHHFLFANMLGESSLAGTDSLMIKKAGGELLGAPVSALPFQAPISLTTNNSGLPSNAPTLLSNVLNIDTNAYVKVFSVEDFGAKGDGKWITDGAISSSSTTFTSSTANFTLSDVGKGIRIRGAGTSSHDLVTTISGFTNSTTVTLSNAASTTVTADTTIYGSDNTTAFQNAIFADSLNGGGRIITKNRIYCFWGALNTSVFGASPNSILYFPISPLGDIRFNNRKHYVFEGESPPNYTPTLFADSLTVSKGTILYAGTEGSGTMPALFGVQSPNTFFNSISYDYFTFKNMTILVPENSTNNGPTIGGLNFYYAAALITENVLVSIDGSAGRSVKPTNEVFGICYPQNESEIQSIATNTQVHGFKYGIIAADDFLGQNVFVLLCNHGLVLTKNVENVQINSLKAYWNTNNIYFPNSTILGTITPGTAYFQITNMMTEVFVSGNWYASQYVVSDSGNNAHGNIYYTVAQAGGTFNNSLYNVYNGTNIISTAIGSASGSVPTLNQVVASSGSVTNVNNAIALSGYRTSSISMSIGHLNFQPFTALNQFIMNNLHFNGTNFVTDTTGASSMLQLNGGTAAFRYGASVSSGGIPTFNTGMSLNSDLSGGIGGAGTLTGSTSFWINWNTTGQLGFNTAYSANAGVSLPVGSSTISPLLWAAATPRTTLLAGQMQFNTGLWIVDSSASKRDTLATRSWVTNNFSGSGSLTFSNGLTNTSGAVTFGGTLTQNTIIDGGASNFNLSLGNGVGNYLGGFNIAATNMSITLRNGGNLSYAGNGIKPSYAASGNTNVALGSTVNSMEIELQTITANRTVTLESPTGTTKMYDFYNTNTSAFTWTFATTVLDLNGNTITTIPNGGHMRITSNATNWYVIDQLNAASSTLLKASADLTGQTAAVTTVTSYAVPGSGGNNTFSIGGYLTVTAVSLDVIQLQVTYTDETSTSRTQSFFVQGTTTGISTTGANGYSPIQIRVKQGTTITVATVLTTGTGSITYDVGSSITQLY